MVIFRRIFRFFWRFIASRLLWTLIGLTLLCLLIWFFGHLITVAGFTLLPDEFTKLVTILVIVVIWALWNIIARARAREADKSFVKELVKPAEKPEPTADQAAVARVGERFSETLDELKRKRIGRRRLLRAMPWYVIIGPPGTGKTTALRQSGLDFPISLDGDLKGVGGTRNCDWFFAEDAVLVDTAGRYVTQDSQPGVDSAEWLGFLDLLKKHRGRRALNGVIVALSVDELLAGDAAVRHHAQEIRKRLNEIEDRLGLRLPVYLVLTKLDLLPGFVPFFDSLTEREREQVWGTTFPLGETSSGGEATTALEELAEALEQRVLERMEKGAEAADRAAIFRFPAELQSLAKSVSRLADIAFAPSRYEAAPWLRGLYLTSATQEGTPVDRFVADLARRFGMPAPDRRAAMRYEPRSFFLTDLFRKVIFREAGIGVFDPKREERRRWIWRGAVTAAATVLVLATFSFTLSYTQQRRAVAAQAERFTDLAQSLRSISNAQAPTDPLDLYDALAAVEEVSSNAELPDGTVLTALGPSAEDGIVLSRDTSYRRALRTLLQPRMTAMLEETMWQNIRDPEFLLDALKVYLMLTDQAAYDLDLVSAWWGEGLPEAAPIDPFPTMEAYDHQMAALELLAFDAAKPQPDLALIEEAQESVRSVPLALRAYRALMSDPAVAGQAEWEPADHAGPRGQQVLMRRSGKTLQDGIKGAYTYKGFHEGVLIRLEDVANQAALDRWVFEGAAVGAAPEASPQLLADILKLYYDDYISEWDAFLADVTLAPMTSLEVAAANLRDLSGQDSALRRLLSAVALETELNRKPANGEGGAKVPNKAFKLLGKAGKYVKKGVKLFGKGKEEDVDRSGKPVAEHFLEIKAAVQEVDGAPPALDGAVMALGALAGELQTIAASRDPEAALVSRGGIAALTSAVANEAEQLPDPLDDWLAGAASETTTFGARAMRDELNAVLRADILPFCRAATAARYPFFQDSRIDVNVVDFERLFSPGGMIDGFVTGKLEPLIDTSRRPWRWRDDAPFSGSALAAFEQARRIRDGIFGPAGGLGFSFTLTPVDLGPSASRVRLDIDGQVVEYYNNPTVPQPITWPGPNQSNTILLSFVPVDGSAATIHKEVGAWALLRLLRAGTFTRTELPELFRLTLSSRGHRAEFELRAASVENPFDLGMFGRFQCPERL
ncbi:MAG: type VI secretion system membrane subunit TssM [Pseudomonadota bacterium]